MNEREPRAADQAAAIQQQTVAGIFDDPEVLERAFLALTRAGYASESISVIRQGERAKDIGAKETQSGKGTVAGVSTGLILGGAATVGVLAIPGIGPVLAAGPIAAIVSGIVAGGSLGGLLGSLVGLGIPQQRANDYEAAIKAGGTLLTVHCSQQAEVEEAARILSTHGADQVEGFATMM